MKTVKFILAIISCLISALLWSPIVYVILNTKTIELPIICLAAFIIICFIVTIGLVINNYITKWFDRSVQRYYNEKRI